MILAALFHPNILGIFDVGREGPTAYVVTELLEGGTLCERLAAEGCAHRSTVQSDILMALGVPHSLPAIQDRRY